MAPQYALRSASALVWMLGVCRLIEVWRCIVSGFQECGGGAVRALNEHYHHSRLLFLAHITTPRLTISHSPYSLCKVFLLAVFLVYLSASLG